jgi:lysophospholipase L1-like esterase
MLRKLLPAALTAAVTAALAVALLPNAAAADRPLPAPSSIAALGDSISRGFNACTPFADCPAQSWSTGDDPAVNSYYQRIQAINPAITGKNFNFARTGARSDALPAQAEAAVAQQAEYVTILMGANDACTTSEAAMTPVDVFRGRIDTALATIKAGTPRSRVLILSIPNAKRLWQIGKDNPATVATWTQVGVCKAMLANATSDAEADVQRRDRVEQRLIDYNTQLAAACANYRFSCRFDGNALFNYPFELNQLNTRDYFHPNTVGQQVLAQLAEENGYSWR